MKRMKMAGAACVILTSVFFFSLHTRGGSIDEEVRSLEGLLGVTIKYREKVPDTWNGSSYRIPSDQAQLKRYLGLIRQEYGKYPPGYLKKGRAAVLVLTEDYSFQGRKQAAMPDPYGNRLYLAINGAYGNKSDTYLIHVLHHELHHCTEYAIWKNQYYVWDEWARLNKPGFSYGKGGQSAYRDSGTDYYSLTNPHQGFVNRYSMTSQEEDRSEIFTLMMSDIERPLLHRFCGSDQILRLKVGKLVSLLNSHMGVSGPDSYWERMNAPCCR